MARNYAALPWEYLEEMDTLEDGEFGRLARALIKYSMTGEPIALTGNERFFAKRVMAQEDRFQGSYRETSERNRENGKKGGRPSRDDGDRNEPNGTQPNQGKPKKTQKNRNEPNGTQKTDTETKTNMIDDNQCARAREDDCATYFLSRVNPNAPQRDLDQLAEYVNAFNQRGGDGNAMVIRACDVALSNRAPRWVYIATVLNNWLKEGTCTPAALDAKERDRRWEQEQANGGGKPADPPKPKDPDAWLKNGKWGVFPPGTL